MKLDNFVEYTINKMVSLGGTMVTEKEYNQRLEACRSCDKAGTVEPLPTVKMEGCTLCKCPLGTKPRFDTYYSVSKLKVIKAECPHESGNKWIF